MALLNSGMGCITNAFVSEISGETIETIFQLFEALDSPCKLFVLLKPNLDPAAEVLYKLYTGSNTNQRVAPFNTHLNKSEFILLLRGDNPDYPKNWYQLIQTIRPKDTSGKQLVIEFDWSHHTFAVEESSSGAMDKGMSLLTSIGDDILIITTDTHPVKIKGDHAAIKNFLSKHGFKIDPVAPAFFIENGDIMVGDGFVFVGIASFFRNYRIGNPDASIEDFKTTLVKAYYKNESPPDIYVVGKPEQMEDDSFYHLDLFFNYAGEVGRNRHLFFCGYIPEEVINLLYANNQEALHSIRLKQTYLNDMYEMFCKIDEERFIIKKIPLVVDGRFIYTFNNALVERKGAIGNYIIPHYTGINENYVSVGGTSAIVQDLVDRYYKIAFSVIEHSGFCVKPVDTSRCANDGINQSLHCIAAVLQRS
ncbi:MAG: hypothetical protein U0T74_08630 [Chitinophagales bacterium]